MPAKLNAQRHHRRITVIKALAHPSRLAIAEALQRGEQCVCDLRELVGADLSTVSKHFFFCFSPMVEGPFKIAPGEDYVSRYRYLVTSKAADVKLIQQHWDDYAKSEK